MLRTVLYLAGGFTAIIALGAGATELRAREDAQRLTREAEQVLSAPLARAPELANLDARKALGLLEEARSYRASKQLAAVQAWATALDEYQKGRLEPAAKALGRAEHELGRSPDLETLGAAIAVRAGRSHEASARVAEALAAAPKHARARMLSADLAQDAGQYERALELVEGLIAEQPEVGALYNRRGLAREALGQSAAALADYDRAAGFDPALPQAQINRGRLLMRDGRQRDAEGAFALAIERAAGEPQAWLGRGMARIALGDTGGGRADLEQARALAPAEPAPLIALGDLDTAQGSLRRAIERYEAAVMLANEDALAWLKLGNALTRGRSFDDARAAFERAIALLPNLAAAHNGLGAALLGQGRRAEAEQAFTTAAELDRDDPNPRLNLALLHGPRAARRPGHGAAARAPRARM